MSEYPEDPYAAVARTARRFRALAGTAPIDLAVVLGSGWGEAAAALGVHERTTATVSMGDLPGFAPPTAEGHRGFLHVVRVGTRRVLLLAGRTHYYEARDPVATVHGVRLAAALGAKTVVLTNAAGSLRREWGPGTVVLINDHLNLTGDSPLRGPRFVDLSQVYDPRLRAHARTVAPELPEGVYAQFGGPAFETPAEVRMAAVLGADLVGMSTALEAIAAREVGMAVLGLSLVTNLAAGLATERLDHADVLAAGERAAEELGNLLHLLLSTWPDPA